MGIFSGLLGKNKIFKSADFEETQMNIKNPSRGWYKVFNFQIDEEPNFEFAKMDMASSDSLALVLIDIGACRKELLSDMHLNRIDRIIQFFAENGKELLLRVAYDHTGNAMEREPSFFAHVTEHAEQITDILRNHANEIFVYQGLLIGNWGEMHGSRFLDFDKIRKLAEVIEKGRPKGLFMAVRKPSQWRSIRNIRTDGSLPEADGLGLFNDGMFGSQNDLGTYGTGNRELSGWSKGWSRNIELDFQNKLCAEVPNGGEAIFSEDFLHIANEARYVEELSIMHATYLNREHDPKMLEFWRKATYKGKGVWKGITMYDYIGAHLGYRFIVRKAELEKINSTEYRIRIQIENTGFADIYRSCVLTLEYQGKNGREESVVDFDLRSCHPGTITECSAVILPFAGEIFLSACQKRDNHPIRFANTGAEENHIRIGEFLG